MTSFLTHPLRGAGAEMKVGRYVVALVIVIGAFIAFGKRGLLDNYLVTKKLASLRETNYALAVDNAKLRKRIVLLKEDLPYIETVARNELGMVKKGDVVYRFAP